MSLRHGLLGLLNYAPMTGYDLNKEFNESLGFFWQAKASQIYRELDAMERAGWLSSERIIQDDKPNKRVYSITAQGKAEFLQWLSSLDPINNALRTKSAFLMRIFFGGELNPESTLELLSVFRQTYLENATHLNTAMEEVNALPHEDERMSKNSKYWKLTALCGEIMYKANLEWVDRAIAILQEEEE